MGLYAIMFEDIEEGGRKGVKIGFVHVRPADGDATTPAYAKASAIFRASMAAHRATGASMDGTSPELLAALDKDIADLALTKKRPEPERTHAAAPPRRAGKGFRR